MPRKASRKTRPRSRTSVTLTERVARLEERSDAAGEERQQILSALGEIRQTLASHTAALDRFRGFTGACLLIGSALAGAWAFLKSLLPYLSGPFR